MGQAEIYELLKNNKETWFSLTDLTKFLSSSQNNVCAARKGLMQRGMINIKKVRHQYREYIYVGWKSPTGKANMERK